MFGVIIAVAVVKTTIALSALGYPNGIPLNGGAFTVRLPARPGVQNILVRFPVQATGTLAHAQVRLDVDGREVAALRGEKLRGGTLQADVPIRAGARDIDITLYSRLAQCGETDAARARIKESGTVVVSQEANAARSPLRTYAGTYTIIESQHPDTTWRERALASAYALHVIERWRRVSVSLGPSPEPGALGVTDLRPISLRNRAPPHGALTFADLGVSPLEQSGEDVDFVVPFTLGQLGDVPNRLVAELRLHASAPSHLDAMFNGREINTFVLAAGTHDVRLPIATSTLRGVNTLRVAIRFDHAPVYCATAAPQVALDGSVLHWSGHGDVAMTLERRVGGLSGRVTVESDPAIFAQAFVALNTLGSLNHTIDAIDVRPLDRGAPRAGEVEIGAATGIATEGKGSYGEVRVEPDGAIVISYIGDPAVLYRLPQFSHLLATSDGTRFEFGMTGAPSTQGGPFATHAEMQRRIRLAMYAAFVVVLVVATFLIARRARRFS